MSSTNPSPSFTGIQYNPEFYKGGVTTQNNKWTGQNTFTVLQAVTPPITENSIYVATTEWVKEQEYLTENVKKINFILTGGPVPGTVFAYADNGIFFINTLTSNEINTNNLIIPTLNVKNVNFNLTNGTPYAYTDENGNFFINSLLSAIIETDYLYVNDGGSIRGVNFVAGANFYEEGGGIVASISNTGIFDCVGTTTQATNDVSTKIATTEYVDNRINAPQGIPDTSLSSNVSLSNSNEIITGIKSFNTSPKIANQYFNGVSTLRTGGFTVSIPYYEIYPLAPTTNITITLPPASASLLGIRIRFRRVGGTITTTISSASANIYPNNSFTPNNVLLASNALNVIITCIYLTSTTYGWFVA